MSSCKEVNIPLPENKSSSEGSTVNLARWENIPAADSRISVIDGEEFIKVRREKDESHRGILTQAYQLTNGSILYEKRDDVIPDAKVSPEESIVIRYGENFSLMTKGFNLENIKAESVKTFDDTGIYYSVIESPNKRCTVYFKYADAKPAKIGSSSVNAKNRKDEAVTAILDESATSSENALLEKEQVVVIDEIPDIEENSLDVSDEEPFAGEELEEPIAAETDKVTGYEETEEGVEPGGRITYQAVTGLICANIGTPEADTLENDMLAFVGNILFDDGEQARKQLLGNALNILDELQAEQKKAELDKEGPLFDVTETFTADQQIMVYQGRVSDDSTIDVVRVDNIWADLKEDGTFSSTIPIPVDRDFLELVAIDQYGNRTEKRIDIVRTYTIEEAVEEKVVNYGKFHALMIANSDYSYWRDLGTPHYDVKAVGNVLSSIYGVEDQTVVLDASQEDIIEALATIRNKMGDDDSLIIFYSGHGVLHNGIGYWVPVDGQLDDPEKWVPNAEISRAIRRNKARHVIVIADSCYSGTLTRGEVNESDDTMLVSRSRTAMSAGSGEEVVLEPVLAEGESGNSVFAFKFLQVLEKNTEEIISGVKVYKQILELFKFFPQHPEYGQLNDAGHEKDADFFFVKKELLNQS